MGRVLIVGDEQMHKILGSILREDGHAVSHAAGVQEAREAIGKHEFEALLTDQKLPDGNSLDVVEVAHEADGSFPAVVVTALRLTAESFGKAFFDFLPKPFTPEVVRATVQRACNHTMLSRENRLLKSELGRIQGSPELFGDTDAMRRARENIAQAALISTPVLIAGESGTGKALVARAIHLQSPRAGRPFLAVNCAGIGGMELEAELFGRERGALKGADRNRLGLFEAAHEGTLFLDEVAEMPPAVQARLLRILTDGEVPRVGTVDAGTVNVRVVSATRHDLAQVVREGLLREDLYRRLAAASITIPPLRDRIADLGTLCDLFLGQIASELKLPTPKLSVQALQRLQSYKFPGNVRELRNLIERAVILSKGEEIGVEHLPLAAGSDVEAGANGRGPVDFTWIEALPPNFDLRGLLSTLEKTLIERTLQSTRGAQAEAARRLGLSRSDLSYKLLKYELRKETAASLESSR